MVEAKLTPVVRDETLERFKQLFASPAFATLTARYEAELARAMRSCERGVGLIEVRRAQGAVAAMRTVLGLPAAMLSELKAGK